MVCLNPDEVFLFIIASCIFWKFSLKFLLLSTVEWMKTANSFTDIFPVLNFKFVSVDMACIAIPMGGCPVNFPDKICFDQPVPHAGKDPALSVSSSVNMPLTSSRTCCSGFSKGIYDNGA